MANEVMSGQEFGRSPKDLPTLPSHQVEGVIQALMAGLKPGSLEYFQALGAEASQNNITPSSSLPPIVRTIRDRFSSDVQKLMRQQQALTELGQVFQKRVLEHVLQQQLSPSIGQMRQQFPGIPIDPSQVKTTLLPPVQLPGLNPADRTGFVEPPVSVPGQVGIGPPQMAPMEGEPGYAFRYPHAATTGLDPMARPTMAQADMYKQLLGGHLIDPDAGLVPPGLQAERERTAAALLKPELKEVGGKLYRVPRQGTAQEVPGVTPGMVAVSDENRLAVAEYGKPFIGLTQEQQKAINHKLMERPLAELDLAQRREAENQARTRITRALAIAGFKESPFDETGQIDIARLLAPGAVDMEKLEHWAESAMEEPGISKAVKQQMEFFYKQIQAAAKMPSKKPTQAKAPIMIPPDRVEEYKKLRQAGKTQEEVLKAMGLTK